MGSVGTLHNRTLYRGVAGPEYVEDLFNSDTPTYMSEGLHGAGLYFTPNRQEAENYGAVNSEASGRQAAVASVALDLSKAKVIEEQEVLRRIRAEGIPHATFEVVEDWLKRNGYNVVYSSKDDYYMVRDKSVLRRK